MSNSYKHTYAISSRKSIDLSLAENPLGPSKRVKLAIINGIKNIHLYPCIEKKLIKLIAKHHDISEKMILLGAGANELIEDVLKAYAIKKRITVPSITFPESINCMKSFLGKVDKVNLNSDLTLNIDNLLLGIKKNTALIHICNPNNPTGIWVDIEQIKYLAKHTTVPILISEAGADYVGLSIIDKYQNSKLIVVRSFSKAYGLAGLRIGYCVAAPGIISKIKSHLRSYRISSLSIYAAIAALQDQEHLIKSVAYIMSEKNWLIKEMKALGFNVISSQGQTFIAKVPSEYNNATDFCKKIQRYGTAVVNCSLYKGLEKYIRISPQLHKVNEKFISILKKLKGEK